MHFDPPLQGRYDGRCRVLYVPWAAFPTLSVRNRLLPRVRQSEGAIRPVADLTALREASTVQYVRALTGNAEKGSTTPIVHRLTR